jgi:hypothetical protein
VACIECVECGDTIGEFERGWRAYIAEDEWKPIEEVAIFCPRCAWREFGAPPVADTDEAD